MVYSRTDVGMKRQNNEDYMLTCSLETGEQIYMVLDGIGGASGGEIASKTAAEKVIEYIKEHYYEHKIEDMLKLAVKYANRCVHEIAKENKVQIVENKALARSLYAAVEVGDAIPEELYQAVAEVLAYVYSMRAS